MSIVVIKMSAKEKIRAARDIGIIGYLLLGIVWYREPYNEMCFVALLPFMVWTFAKALEDGIEKVNQ